MDNMSELKKNIPPADNPINRGISAQNIPNLEKRTYRDILLEKQLNEQKAMAVNTEEEFKRVKRLKEETTSKFEDAPERQASRWDMKTRIDNGSSVKDHALSVKSALVNPSLGSGWDKSARQKKLNIGDETRVGDSTAQTVKSYFADINRENESVVESLAHEQFAAFRTENNLLERNRRLTDKEIDELLPKEGYEILKPPADYKPKLATKELGEAEQYTVPERQDLPSMTPDDLKYFGDLLASEKNLSPQEQRERKVMALLLKIKNGTPEIRRQAMKTLTERAKDYGPGSILSQLLPLLLSPVLDAYERHLMVKTLDRCLYKFGELVKPYVHNILVVVEPMLVDDDYFVRIEGREIISNLAKAAGLPAMITALRPNVDHNDLHVRNATARALAVVALALSIPSVLPFIKAVCKSQKSWQARYTGCKMVQQVATMLASGLLPHLPGLLECVKNCLKDENQKVRVSAALAIASLAEASNPFGIETFDVVLEDLWVGLNGHRGKALASFLKAVGAIIPLMDDTFAADYTKLVMHVVLKEFESPDDEMKRILLTVIKQCIEAKLVTSDYVKDTILEPFWQHFWTRKICMDRITSKALIECTVALAGKIGPAIVLQKLTFNLKEDHDVYRRVSVQAVDGIVKQYGVADLDARLEELLVDSLIFAFHQQSDDSDNTILDGFTTVINALELRAQKYLPQIVANICIRLKTKSPKVRQQAADLVVGLAHIISFCGEDKLLSTLSTILYENLGEEYPEVLGSILRSLEAIINVVGINRMNPSIQDLLPTLTPILKNRHEKVQENLINLIGSIADKGAEAINAKEWIRICFDLLDLLRAPKKSIRRSAVNTFGYIAKAIGPQDVLVTLINNLKVQERSMRICTTVAIAIIAEACGPFTVLPALMNEYRTPDNNVQNGILKAIAFMFEYIGPVAKDYVYAITPLLKDALYDRDLVHRQIATSALKNLSLGVMGFACEDALLHLFNFAFANVFETSPHAVNAVFEAFEGMRLSLGPGFMLLYILQGLFHPAKKVRNIYWKFYNMLYIGSQDALTPFYPVLPTYENDVPYDFQESTFYQI